MELDDDKLLGDKVQEDILKQFNGLNRSIFLYGDDTLDVTYIAVLHYSL